MDQSFLGLCHSLYSFIVKCLATLVHGSDKGSAQLPSSSAASAISSSVPNQATDPVAQEPPQGDASLNAETEPGPALNHKNVEEMGDGSISSATSKEEKNEEEAAVSTLIAHEAQPPKKMVSINDTVEEIAASRKKSKKKRTEKLGSFDQEIEEPKPLKSILKVGSKQDYENS
ncbi:hypothetical protein DITRI_Ditri20bG0019100 [Diplodiscus trichospermus]